MLQKVAADVLSALRRADAALYEELMPQAPKSRPVLTHATLDKWQAAAGPDCFESLMRSGLAETILSSATRQHGLKPPKISFVRRHLAIGEARHRQPPPEILHDRGDLRLKYVIVTHLPPGLSVAGTLRSRNCYPLKALPEGLCVGGDLYLAECIALEHVPAGLHIGGHFSLFDCKLLTNLPDDMATWGYRADGGIRHITIIGSAIPAAVRERFQKTGAPGMQFYFELPSYGGEPQ